MTTSSQTKLLEHLKQLGIRKLENLKAEPFVAQKRCVLPYAFVKKQKILPLDDASGKLKVAMADPFNQELVEEIRSMTGMGIIECYAQEDMIEDAIENCYEQNTETKQYIESLESQEKNDEEVEEYDLLDQKSDSPVIQLLNLILREAIQQEASDIHFEPQENSLVVRYRIDGVLQKRHSPPKEYQSQLLTRIKVMSCLDIAEHRLPQDGRIKVKMGKREIDFRVSTVPIVFGERIVLRILDKNNVIDLEQIGMPKKTLERFKHYIAQNQGIILVTGPTGSGKTTSLYGALSEIGSTETNIMTIEDPVEYKLPNMAQIGVNPKINLTFSVGLRHILRQDPDVIMIGEIRDVETAEIAIQASLTGHLVLSTLHTNDAPSALTRLVDMGIEPYLLTSSVIAVLAQRLVREICPDCKESYKPSKEELKDLGLDADKLYRGKGCANCMNSGYRGRRGIYELMDVTTQIKQQLLKNIDATALRSVAMDEGMLSLRHEAAQLALVGVTTHAEVLRVTRNLDLGG